MLDALTIIMALVVAAFGAFTVLFVISSAREGEGRAAFLGGVVFVLLVGVGMSLLAIRASGFLSGPPGSAVLLGGVLVTSGGLILILKRDSRNPRALQGTQGYTVGDVKRFDEREQVFARNRSLRPGSEQYGAFYNDHPDWEAHDAERRGRGGPLGVPGTIDRPHERPNVAAALSAFSIPQFLGSTQISQPEAHPHIRDERFVMSPEEATLRVKGFARHLGANLVGVAELSQNWVYAKRGEIFYENWHEWGQDIRVDHPYAIVLAMEMNREMVWAAPHTPSVLESGIVYAHGAFIATQLASFIANLGYSATANHVRHYDLLLVPLAMDAGLGEVGRFGYLITKEFGPRVRLGAVTTDLPLVTDAPVDIGVEDFCRTCQKCARCCPSQSIPFDDLREVNNTLRWKINAETCFDYWGKIGTDCNVCMRVCPWSHPRTLPHWVITEMVIRNGIVRRHFSRFDDLFYGKYPKPCSALPWAAFRTRRSGSDS
jgi:reductive dehalogenase